MNNKITGTVSSRLWGEFRFSVVGGLLASPPESGTLCKHLIELHHKTWMHPITGLPVKFCYGTLEEWYYIAKKNQKDPVTALRRGRRRDKGHGRDLNLQFKVELKKQYDLYPDWTVKLHADNLKSLALKIPEIKPVPSYMTVLRYMKQEGLRRKKKVRRKETAGSILASVRLDRHEVRSYEVEHFGALFHLDFHKLKRKVRNNRGEWIELSCLAIHDDHSRLVCHIQWYTQETAENLIHGLMQGIQRRGMPWSLMTDNGAAMISGEFTQGLSRLGIMHSPTLPYSPYQNGKTERFWATLEGRLMAMLKGQELTQKFLNEATLAWVELDYNKTINREIATTPYDRYISSPSVTRHAPTWEDCRNAFRLEILRKQRRTDGTISIDGTRFEIPSQYRSLENIRVHYARWDLSYVHLVNEESKLLCRLHPIDKAANASGRRRIIEEREINLTEPETPTSLPPLLDQLMSDFAATGIPYPYLPENSGETHEIQ